jgi:hypothetical protein
MADASCNVCKVPLCFKKPRFPGQTKTCWEIFHTQEDLWYGECATLCHVCNPQEELRIDCTLKEPQETNAIVDYSKRKKRTLKTIAYGGRVMPQRERSVRTVKERKVTNVSVDSLKRKKPKGVNVIAKKRK